MARASEISSDLLPDWVRGDTATWEPLVRELAGHDVRLVHFDIRNDNLLTLNDFRIDLSRRMLTGAERRLGIS